MRWLDGLRPPTSISHASVNSCKRASKATHTGTASLSVEIVWKPGRLAPPVDGDVSWAGWEPENVWTFPWPCSSVSDLTIPTGVLPRRVVFDGANIWVVNAVSDSVIRLSLVN